MFSSLATFAQSYSDSYDYSYDSTGDGTAAAATLGAIVVFYLLVTLLIAVPAIIGLWKVFKKAGQPGWAAIVPFYNLYIWLKIVGRPSWWLAIAIGGMLLSFIPFIGLIAGLGMLAFYIIIGIDLAKSFGKDAGTGVLIGLLPFIGLPVLGFSKDATYKGPSVGTDIAPTPTVADTPYPKINKATDESKDDEPKV